MNRLVMDYLVGKGYRDVAEAFLRQSGTQRELFVQLEVVPYELTHPRT